METLVIQLASLAGFAALVSVVINILKTFKVIKDDQAQYYSSGLNLLGLVGLFFFNVYKPPVDLVYLDQQIGVVAQLLMLVFGYVAQLGVSKVSHIAVKGLPLIGYSYSQQEAIKGKKFTSDIANMVKCSPEEAELLKQK